MFIQPPTGNGDIERVWRYILMTHREFGGHLIFVSEVMCFLKPITAHNQKESSTKCKSTGILQHSVMLHLKWQENRVPIAILWFLWYEQEELEKYYKIYINQNFMVRENLLLITVQLCFSRHGNPNGYYSPSLGMTFYKTMS